MKKALFLVLSSLSLLVSFGLKAQQLMTRAQVYNYNIGDVFEYQLEWGSSVGAAHIDTITGKHYSANLDTVFYIVNTYGVTFAQCPQPCTSSYSSSIGDTIFFTNLEDTVGIGLGTKPYEFLCFDTVGFTGTYMDTTYYNHEYCDKPTTRITSLSNGPMQLSDSCYGFFEPYFENWEYGLGLGQIFHSINTCSNGFPNCSSSQHLRYYKKGSDSCGTYLNVLPIGIKDISNHNETIKIIPNPACDYFILDNPTQGKCEITIYNSIGVSVLRKTINENKQISLKDLEEGIYFIQIKTSETTFSKKLIVDKG